MEDVHAWAKERNIEIFDPASGQMTEAVKNDIEEGRSIQPPESVSLEHWGTIAASVDAMEGRYPGYIHEGLQRIVVGSKMADSQGGVTLASVLRTTPDGATPVSADPQMVRENQQNPFQSTLILNAAVIDGTAGTVQWGSRTVSASWADTYNHEMGHVIQNQEPALLLTTWDNPIGRAAEDTKLYTQDWKLTVNGSRWISPYAGVNVRELHSEVVALKANPALFAALTPTAQTRINEFVDALNMRIARGSVFSGGYQPSNRGPVLKSVKHLTAEPQFSNETVWYDANGNDIGSNYLYTLTAEKAVAPDIKKAGPHELPGYNRRKAIEDKHRDAIKAALGKVVGISKAVQKAAQTPSDSPAHQQEIIAQAVEQHVSYDASDLADAIQAASEDAVIAGAERAVEDAGIEEAAQGSRVAALYGSLKVLAETIMQNSLGKAAASIGAGMRAGMTDDEIVQRVMDSVASDDRADVIIVTQVADAENASYLDQIASAGYTTWEWLAYEGACVYCEDNSGEHDIDDTDAWDNRHPNCRCVQVLPENANNLEEVTTASETDQ